MGQDTYVVGFVPPDAKWKKMKKIWEACKEAEIEAPDEVDSFFEGEDPANLPGKEIEIFGAIKEWQDDGREGWDVDVNKLPKNVTVVRFYHSY